MGRIQQLIDSIDDCIEKNTKDSRRWSDNPSDRVEYILGISRGPFEPKPMTPEQIKLIESIDGDYDDSNWWSGAWESNITVYKSAGYADYFIDYTAEERYTQYLESEEFEHNRFVNYINNFVDDNNRSEIKAYEFAFNYGSHSDYSTPSNPMHDFRTALNTLTGDRYLITPEGWRSLNNVIPMNPDSSQGVNVEHVLVDEAFAWQAPSQEDRYNLANIQARFMITNTIVTSDFIRRIEGLPPRQADTTVSSLTNLLRQYRDSITEEEN